jgi:hypothetical protein
LGCKVVRDREKRTVALSQTAYTRKILAISRMEECNKGLIPMESGYKPVKNPTVTDPKTVNEYQRYMGYFNWLSMKTRPDIAFATMRLQSQAANPSTTDMKAAKTLFRYLKGNNSFVLVFGLDPTQKLCGYVDSSHQDWEDGKSTESYIFILAGTPVS